MMQYLRIIMGRAACSCLALCCMCSFPSGQERPGTQISADAALRTACQTIEAVQTLHFEYAAPYTGTVPVPPDPILRFDQRQRLVQDFAERWWDARGLYRNRHELLTYIDGKPTYDRYEFTVDGQFYRGASYTRKTAKIRHQVIAPSQGILTPIELLGYELFGLPTHIYRAVLEARCFEPGTSIDENGLIIVRALLRPPNKSTPRRLVIALDPRHGYLPVRLTAFFDWSGTRNLDYTITKVGNINGVRVPLSGTKLGCAVVEQYPDGLTNADINAMSKEEYAAIADRVTAVEDCGFLTECSFSESEIQVNEVYEDDFSHLPIPADCRLFDFSGNEPVVSEPAEPVSALFPDPVGKGSTIPAREGLRASAFTVWAGVFLILNVLSIGSVVVVRNLRQRLNG